MSYITESQFDRSLSLPLSLPQTELRRGKFLTVATVVLQTNQQLWLRSLTLHLVKTLNPGKSPTYRNQRLGLVSAGLYYGSNIASPIVRVRLTDTGAKAIHPFGYCRVLTPGIYSVLVSNNTQNLDFAVVVTGEAKVFL